MNWADWYTDRMTVRRVQNVLDGALTRQERVEALRDIPCRIYSSSKHSPRMQSTAAYTESGDDKISCANSVDIRAGDEVLIYRGKGLGQAQKPIRAFAGEPVQYYEPFGAVIPGLAHQEFAILEKEYIEETEMALGDALQKRMEELAKRQAAIPKRFAAISEGATLRAVAEAQDHTPPNTFEGDEQRGVHTITGELSAHWKKDSQKIPIRVGSDFRTTLENKQEYASYVNDGHDVDKHFVAGLYIDDHGLLSFAPKEADREKLRKDGVKVGMMVGTKTTSVEALDMKEAGIDKFKEVCEIELPKLAREMFQ